MTRWEYKVVPAPKRGLKVKGAKATEDRFAAALEDVMNPLGAEGWDYVRSDTLPVEERQGLTGKTTTYQNMLVFRRALPPPVVPEAAPLVLRAEAGRSPAPPVTQPDPAPMPPVDPAIPRDGV